MGNTNIKKMTIKGKKGSPLVLDLEDFLNTGNSSVNRNLFIYNKATTVNLRRSDYKYTQITADSASQIVAKVQAIYSDTISLVDKKTVQSANKISTTFIATDRLYGITLGINGSKRDSVCTIKFDEPYNVNTIFTVSFVVTTVTQGSVSFRDIKIELGDKATEWSVAPEEDFHTLYTSQYNSIIQTDKNLDDVQSLLNTSKNNLISNLIQTSITNTSREYGSQTDYTILKEIEITVPVSGYYNISQKFTYNNTTSIGATAAEATQSGEVVKTIVKNPIIKVKQNDILLKTVDSPYSYTKTINFTSDNGGTKYEDEQGLLSDINVNHTDILYLNKGLVVLQVEAVVYQKVALSVGQSGSAYSKLAFDYFYQVSNAENQIILANDGVAITQAGGTCFKVYNSQNSLLNVQMNGLPTDSTNLKTGQLYSNNGTLMIKQ